MTVHLDPESPLTDLATIFARSLKSERKSAQTLEVYLRAVFEYDRYAAAHGLPRDVRKIKRSHVEQFLEDQIERFKPATAATRYSGLRRFFAWCVDEREITTSPMDKTRPPKVPETEKMALTDEQIEAILRACEGPSFRQRRDRAILGFLADTGCRRSEVAGLRLRDIDQERQMAVVTGKGDKTREVVYSVRTAVAIDKYLMLRKKHRRAGSDMLWLGQYGPMSGGAIADVVARRSARAGVFRVVDGQRLPVHPHLFRHHFADAFLSKGGNEGDLMTLGGWSSADVMRQYGRGRRTERAVDAARRLLFAS